MVDVNDLGPSSSYSDPFYDRLDAAFIFIKKSWPLVVLVMLIIIGGVFALMWMMQRHPEAGSAVRYITAVRTPDEAQRIAALTTVAAEPSITPVFRAIAENDLVQAQLMKGDTAGASPLATKTVELAGQSKDFALQLVAKLSRAGTFQQAKEFDQAATAYTEVKRVAGAKYPMAQFEAAMGLSRTLALQGKTDDAIAELETLISRNDESAKQLISMAQMLYWELKRTQAEAKLAPPMTAPVDTAASPQAPTLVVPVPAVDNAIVVPVPAVPAVPAGQVVPPAAPVAVPQPK